MKSILSILSKEKIVKASTFFKLVTCRSVADAEAFILLHYAVKTEKSSALQLILQFILKESTS